MRADEEREKKLELKINENTERELEEVTKTGRKKCNQMKSVPNIRSCRLI